jgi:hypothetical protein
MGRFDTYVLKMILNNFKDSMLKKELRTFQKKNSWSSFYKILLIEKIFF